MYKNEEQKIMFYLTKHFAGLRKERKLSQNVFSELINVQIEHLAKVETRRRNLTLRLLIRASIALDIPLKDLFDFEIGEDNIK